MSKLRGEDGETVALDVEFAKVGQLPDFLRKFNLEQEQPFG